MDPIGIHPGCADHNRPIDADVECESPERPPFLESIFRSSRQLRSEAQEVFYSQNTFAINIKVHSHRPREILPF